MLSARYYNTEVGGVEAVRLTLSIVRCACLVPERIDQGLARSCFSWSQPVVP